MTAGYGGIVAADVALDVSVKGKKGLLESLAADASVRIGRDEREILEALQSREQLGPTAIGKGVALPHAQLSGAFAPVILFRRLSRSIDFDDREGEPVDIVVMALWPEAAPKGSLLDAVAEICRALREPELVRGLRAAQAPGEVARLLSGSLSVDPGAAEKTGRDPPR